MVRQNRANTRQVIQLEIARCLEVCKVTVSQRIIGLNDIKDFLNLLCSSCVDPVRNKDAVQIFNTRREKHTRHSSDKRIVDVFCAGVNSVHCHKNHSVFRHKNFFAVGKGNCIILSTIGSFDQGEYLTKCLTYLGAVDFFQTIYFLPWQIACNNAPGFQSNTPASFVGNMPSTRFSYPQPSCN